MDSPTGIIPEELMYPQKLGQVMYFLVGVPGGSTEKVKVFRGWAKDVGVKLTPSQVAVIMNSGDDR